MTVAEPKGVNKLLAAGAGPRHRLAEDDQQRLVGQRYPRQPASDPARGVRMVYAEFDAGVAAPTLIVTSKLQTRNRSVDLAPRDGGRRDAATPAVPRPD